METPALIPRPERTLTGIDLAGGLGAIERLGETVFDEFEIGLHLGFDGRIAGRLLDGRVTDEATAPVLVLLDRNDGCIEQIADGLVNRTRPVERLRDPAQCILPVALQGRQVEIVLVAKGGVKTAAVDAERIDQVLDRCALVTPRPEDIDGLVEDRFGVELFRSRHGETPVIGDGVSRYVGVLERLFKNPSAHRFAFSVSKSRCRRRRPRPIKDGHRMYSSDHQA